MSESKAERILRELREEISTGKLGRCGDIFMTTRELCKYKDISLKTSFRILTELKAERILERSGRYNRIASVIPVLPEQGAPLLIGFLATSLESPYFAQLAMHAEEIVHSVGGSMIIASSNHSFATEKERLQMFCRQRVSGILICPWASGAEEESFYDTLGVPYVMLGRNLETVSCDAVLVNNEKASQEVAAHFLSQGIREFAYVGQSGKSQDQRLFGFRTGLMQAGLELREEDILRTDYSSKSDCYDAIMGLLNRRRRGPLGLFCYHDLFASRALNVCHKLRLRVPDQVAIAGFDDLPRAEEMYPPLTSVSYPIREMAQLAFESLYARIKFRAISQGVSRYLDSQLVIRESSLLRKVWSEDF